MTQADLPEDVLELIARHVATMDQVEVLLLLRRESEHGWRARDAAGELRMTSDAAAAAMTALHAQRILTPDPDEAGAFRYAPRNEALRAAVDKLEIAYNTRPVTLVKALYNRPSRNVQSFADAFRLRKPDDEGT